MVVAVEQVECRKACHVQFSRATDERFMRAATQHRTAGNFSGSPDRRFFTGGGAGPTVSGLPEGAPPSGSAEPEPEPAALDSDEESVGSGMFDGSDDDEFGGGGAAPAPAAVAAAALPKARRRSHQSANDALSCSEGRSPIAAALSPHTYVAKGCRHGAWSAVRASQAGARDERMVRELERADGGIGSGAVQICAHACDNWRPEGHASS